MAAASNGLEALGSASRSAALRHFVARIEKDRSPTLCLKAFSGANLGGYCDAPGAWNGWTVDSCQVDGWDLGPATQVWQQGSGKYNACSTTSATS